MQVYNSKWQQVLLTKKYTLLLSILVQKNRSAETCSLHACKFFFKLWDLVIIPQVEGTFPVLGNDSFSSSGEMLFGLRAQVHLDLRLSLVWISAANNANTASCILKSKIHAAVIYYLGGSCESTLTPCIWAEFYIWGKSKLSKFFLNSSWSFTLCCQMWTCPQPTLFQNQRQEKPSFQFNLPLSPTATRHHPAVCEDSDRSNAQDMPLAKTWIWLSRWVLQKDAHWLEQELTHTSVQHLLTLVIEQGLAPDMPVQHAARARWRLSASLLLTLEHV